MTATVAVTVGVTAAPARRGPGSQGSQGRGPVTVGSPGDPRPGPDCTPGPPESPSPLVTVRLHGLTLSRHPGPGQGPACHGLPGQAGAAASLEPGAAAA
jgi:hypothetical protein